MLAVERRNKIDFIEKEPIKICLNGIRIEYIKIDLFDNTLTFKVE